MQTRRSKLDIVRHWIGFVKLCHRPRSPNSAKLKCPWEGPRFRNRTRTKKWPTFVWHRSTGCIPMQAQVFGWLCPPNSCSTTRIVQPDRLHPWVQSRRLRPLPPLRQLNQPGQDHPVPPLVQADLEVLPPHWNNSKWFYSLNIQNTMTTTMPFILSAGLCLCMCVCVCVWGYIHAL